MQIFLIILLIIVGVLFVYECFSLVKTIVQRKKNKKQNDIEHEIIDTDDEKKM